jgi:hypothetical protein
MLIVGFSNAPFANDDSRTPEQREQFSLSHRMGEGRGEGWF